MLKSILGHDHRSVPLIQVMSKLLVSAWVVVSVAACVPAAPSSSSSSVFSSSSSSFSSSVRPSSSSSSSSVASSSSQNAVSYTPIQQGCSGYATRFWDCCKPHCGWSGNMPMGVKPNNSCGKANDPLSDINAASACGNGNAHTCYGLVPFEVNNKVSYGYAATQAGDVCGRCYQLDFTGSSHNAGNDPGSAALRGKTMIVQALNIGGDVGGGQFDILVPGGGVGLFNACSAQWGVSNQELGEQYGGLLAACKKQLGYDKSLSDYKSCLTNRCNSVFGNRGLTDLHKGCLWYANWFEAADNPAVKYKEVKCPAELIKRSGMDRTFLNDVSNRCGN